MKGHHIYYHFQSQMIILLCVIMLFHMTGRLAFASDESEMIQARQLFYQSVENSQDIERTIRLFKEIGKSKAYEGLALTYIGALTALKGKFAFFPFTKYRYVRKGLQFMDQGVLRSPNNIEARFIRGMTCYYLPFFFKRKKTAHSDFRAIVEQLSTEYCKYDAQMITNVTDFLLDNAELSAEETSTIEHVRSLIAQDES